MAVSKQELSIRANQFIGFFREEFANTPLSVARPSGDGNPEVTVINGKDRSFIRLEFQPSAIRSEDHTYMIDEDVDEDLFKKIAQDIRSDLL